MPQPRTTANRGALAAVGLALLAGGAWLATAGTSVVGRLPSWWPVPSPDSALWDRDALADLRAHDWWTPAVIAGGAVLTLLLVWWFAGQLVVRGRSRLPLAAPGGSLRTHALSAALSERAATIDGIAHCRADLHARRQHLRLSLYVRLDPDTPPETVIEPLTALVAEAERATVPYTLDARLRFGHRAHRKPHVR
ncbi:hypothetical protein ABT160_33190 [Streptomyces sp. NPDC001941]|uniref:hypothetical protein n=1 Tax=Streptomyces sp. NPDC001941 TaxID=3154659 RepID=UPI00331C2C78